MVDAACTDGSAWDGGGTPLGASGGGEACSVFTAACVAEPTAGTGLAAPNVTNCARPASAMSSSRDAAAMAGAGSFIPCRGWCGAGDCSQGDSMERTDEVDDDVAAAAAAAAAAAGTASSCSAKLASWRNGASKVCENVCVGVGNAAALRAAAAAARVLAVSPPPSPADAADASSLLHHNTAPLRIECDSSCAWCKQGATTGEAGRGNSGGTHVESCAECGEAEEVCVCVCVAVCESVCVRSSEPVDSLKMSSSTSRGMMPRSTCGPSPHHHCEWDKCAGQATRTSPTSSAPQGCLRRRAPQQSSGQLGRGLAHVPAEGAALR
jgi:hypothetical protein